jgi:hypothetical protein
MYSVQKRNGTTKQMTRREFHDYLINAGQTKRRDSIPARWRDEYSGELSIWKTRAGYYYAVIN